MTRRRLAVIAALAAALVGASVPAWAYFSASAPSTIEADASSLSPVTAVTVAFTDANHAAVSWTNPQPANPSGTAYVVTANGQSFCSVVDDHACSAGSLAAGTSYEFAVQPTIGSSWKATSVAANATTPTLGLTLTSPNFTTLPETESGTLSGFPIGAVLSWYLDGDPAKSLSGTATLPASHTVSVTIPTGAAPGPHTVSVASGGLSAAATVNFTPTASGPDAPTLVSLTNGGGDGNAYINAKNAASVNVAVTLPSTSLATDTVHMSATDAGTAHTVTASAVGTAGVGTVTFTLDLHSLSDGAITFTAYVANSGGASVSLTTTATKDTVAPSAPAATYIDAGQPSQKDAVSGTAEPGSTITVNETAPNAKLWVGTAAADGTYSVTVDPLHGTNGQKISYVYSITATDVAGNVSTAEIVIGNDTS